MDEAEQRFAQVYAGLLSRLDPDPVRSEQTLRAIQAVIGGLRDDPEKETRGGSNPR